MQYADDRRNVASDAHERRKDFLDQSEAQRLIEAAKHGRHGPRNHLLVLMLYHHGLRASEAVNLKISDVNLERARLWVPRLKGSLSTMHPIPGSELRALKRYLAARDSQLPWLFVSERGTQMTRSAVFRIVKDAGLRAGLGHVWPHMLRHSCGYYLADKGIDFRVAQDYLGHRDPKHTQRYTRIAGKRFENIW